LRARRKPRPCDFMSTPRRHHYLPVCYLKNFSDPNTGTLFVYEQGKKPRASSAKAEAAITDFYAYTADKEKKFDAEAALQRIESRTAPLLAELNRNEQTRKRRLLTTDEKDILRRFIGVSFTRVPAFMELNEKIARPATKKILAKAASDPAGFSSLLRELLKHLELADEQIEATRQHILCGALSGADPPDLRLEEMFYDGELVARHLEEFDCLIIRAPRHEDFITGDVPLFTGVDRGGRMELGWGFEHTEVSAWFPIGRKIGLLWKRNFGDGYAQLPSRGVRIMNRNIMRFATRYIYAARYMTRTAVDFDRLRGKIRLGVDAFIPTYDNEQIKFDG
jgi:hypothetical protein